MPTRSEQVRAARNAVANELDLNCVSSTCMQRWGEFLDVLNLPPSPAPGSFAEGVEAAADLVDKVQRGYYTHADPAKLPDMIRALAPEPEAHSEKCPTCGRRRDEPGRFIGVPPTLNVCADPHHRNEVTPPEPEPTRGGAVGEAREAFYRAARRRTTSSSAPRPRPAGRKAGAARGVPMSDFADDLKALREKATEGDWRDEVPLMAFLRRNAAAIERVVRAAMAERHDGIGITPELDAALDELGGK